MALALLVAPAADDESSLFEHATAGTLHPFGYDAGLISSDLPDELAHHLDTKMLEAPVFGSRSISTSLTLM